MTDNEMTERLAEIQARLDVARHWPTTAEIGQERADLAYLLARVATLVAQVAAVREVVEPIQLRPDLKDGWNVLRDIVNAALDSAGGADE